jgi:drug/metabolite transporter (DMT)-like permease
LDSASVTPVDSAKTHKPVRSRSLMNTLMFVATVSWAVNIVAGKEALLGLGPVALAQVRIAGAALMFLAMFLAWPGRPILRMTRRELGWWLLVALNGVTLNQLFFIGGLARTSVAHAGLIVALGPVMVLVLACLRRLEVMTVTRVLGTLISFVGIVVLTLTNSGQGNGETLIGDLVVLAGTTVFAYFTIQVKSVADRVDAVTLNMLTFGLGAVLMLPFGARAVWSVRWSGLTAPVGLAVAYMVVFGSVVPYLIYAFAMSEISASRAAAFSYLQPVIAAGLAIWLLAEKLTWQVTFGGVLILLGVYLAEREPGEEPGTGLELRT